VPLGLVEYEFFPKTDEDNLYVTDQVAHAIFRIDTVTGEQTTVFQGDSTFGPFGITVIRNAVLPIELTTAMMPPEMYILEQNFPNPFNPSTTIEYYIPRKAHVIIDIFTILGEKVKTLVDSEMPAGSHAVLWNSGGQASGIYLYRMQVNTGNTINLLGKMILLK